METTGQPGRIQVSEHVFRRVAAIPGQPFAFEHGHKAYCKGFGAVNSYFVRCCSEPPPKDLMLQLGLEPRYGLFYFDNVLTDTRAGANYAGAAPASVHQSGSGGDSRSHTSSQSDGKYNPRLSQPADPALDVVEYED